MSERKMREVLERAMAALCELHGIDTESECVTIDVRDEIELCRAALAKREAQEPSDIAKDAERYRWLRANWTTMRSTATDTTLKLTTGEEPWADFGPDVIDAAIDEARALLAKQGGSDEGRV